MPAAAGRGELFGRELFERVEQAGRGPRAVGVVCLDEFYHGSFLTHMRERESRAKSLQVCGQLSLVWGRGRFSFLAEHCDGTWRSPVAHLNGVQGAAGSNPAVPTGWK